MKNGKSKKTIEISQEVEVSNGIILLDFKILGE